MIPSAELAVLCRAAVLLIAFCGAPSGHPFEMSAAAQEMSMRAAYGRPEANCITVLMVQSDNTLRNTPD